MAHFDDLAAMVYRGALLFVVANTFIQIGLQKFNGFDALAIVLLINAVTQPLLTHYGYILEIALSGIVGVLCWSSHFSQGATTSTAMRFLTRADGYYWNVHPTQWDSSQTITGKAAAKRERVTYKTSSQ